jgi:hypothetical protein
MLIFSLVEVASLKISNSPLRPSCLMTWGGVLVPSSKFAITPALAQALVLPPPEPPLPLPALLLPALPPPAPPLPVVPPLVLPAEPPWLDEPPPAPPLLVLPPAPVPPTQLPFEHVCPFVHALLQPPQLEVLVFVSVHAPLHVT